MEAQRVKLETDLKNRAHRTTQLQLEINNLRTADGQTLAELVGERERVQARSLQQRLEQLVAVHRQLLRKFAMLELENGEAKKKIQLRDERIRQLEQSSRSIVGNMRGQAERHVADLLSLKEQIQTLRTEQQERAEAAARFQPGGPSGGNASTGGPSSHSKRSVRGGGGHHDATGAGAAAYHDSEAKTVRGGGGGGGGDGSPTAAALEHRKVPSAPSSAGGSGGVAGSSPSLSLKGSLLSAYEAEAADVGQDAPPPPPPPPPLPSGSGPAAVAAAGGPGHPRSQFNSAGMPLSPESPASKPGANVVRKPSLGGSLLRGLGFGK